MPVGPAFPAVLAAAQTGAEWAITLLYRELQPKLLRYLRGHAPDDAEDLASEVWLAAARTLPRFDGDEEDFRGWFFTIAKRRLIDHRRSHGRRSDAVALHAVAERAAPDGAPAEPLGVGDPLVAHLGALPADQREVVLLRVVADLSVADVAAIMGKKPGTIRVLQHRALERLAELVAAEGAVVTR
jgi:RNA polymerase sigma factor (sigma-70 family)